MPECLFYQGRDSPRRATTSAHATAPSRSSLASPRARSTRVDGVGRPGPESRANATSDPKAATASAQVVGGGAPARLADVATRGPPWRQSSRARPRPGTLTATEAPPANTPSGRPGAAGRTRVNGPGQ